ncbi:MAG: transposase, partial [Bacteroidales bacterium]
PTANKHYEIEVKQQKGITTEVTWKRKPIPANSKPGEGVYFIRTSLPSKDEKLVWDIYNTIRQIEEAFRVLKTDLSLRPVHHKKAPHTIAHLFLGVIAYTVVHTIRHRLKNHSIHHDWRNIVRIMNTQKAGTITMKRADGKKLNVRVCIKPIPEVEKIYDMMDYKQMPFHRKKFVFPES